MMRFCPRCGGALFPRRKLNRTVLVCLKCGYVELVRVESSRGASVLDLVEEALLKERFRAVNDAMRVVYEAHVISVSSGIATLECRHAHVFHPGDTVGVLREGCVEYLGTVLDSTVNTLTILLEDCGAVGEGEEVQLLDYEPLISYDLQMDVLRYVKGERENLRIKVFNEYAIDLFFGEAKQPDLRYAEVPDPRDVRDGFRLDEWQLKVVSAALALRENEILLVVGPPGTGKTRVIAKIAYELMKRGERVLIASHTNRAVDNAIELLPIENALRVGRPEKVLGHVRPYLLSYRARRLLGRRLMELEDGIREALRKVRSLQEELRVCGDRFAREALRSAVSEWMGRLRDLFVERSRLVKEAAEDLVARVNVVGSTLVKSQLHPMRDLQFDTVIIDEASQASVTLALLAMVKGRKWVVVGDHKQLLPVFRTVNDVRLREELSAFTKLLRRYRHRRLWLRIHYRSHPDIIGFSAKYVYGGMILPHESCRNKKLALKSKPRISALDPEKPAVFIHVDSRSEPANSSKINIVEARVVAELVNELVRCGVPETAIGVITPYRAQRAYIIELLKELVEKGLEVSTIDAFQGREKDAVIFDVTDTENFTFSTDTNRLNVAFTRARHKLIVIGNAKAITRKAKGTLLHKFITHCLQKHAAYHWKNSTTHKTHPLPP